MQNSAARFTGKYSMKLLSLILISSLFVLQSAIGADIQLTVSSDDQAPKPTSIVGFIYCDKRVLTQDDNGQMFFDETRRTKKCILGLDLKTHILTEPYEGRPLVCSLDGKVQLQNSSNEMNDAIKVAIQLDSSIKTDDGKFLVMNQDGKHLQLSFNPTNLVTFRQVERNPGFFILYNAKTIDEDYSIRDKLNNFQNKIISRSWDFHWQFLELSMKILLRRWRICLIFVLV